MEQKTALLIIDAQVGLLEGERPVYQGEEVVARLAGLIAKAREAGVPVVYVQDVDVAPVGTPAWQVHPNLAPQEQDVLVSKKSTDAFYGTPLHEELNARGITHLVVGGCKTEYCVDSTCRRATTLQYFVTLVEDGHTTTDNRVLSAEQIIAHHNCNLHGLDNLEHYIVVKEASEITF